MVVPVHKSNGPKTLTDFTPAALTDILMKDFQQLVRSEITRRTGHVLDPMQFACRPHGGVQDVAHFLNTWREVGVMLHFFFMTFHELVTPSKPTS